MLFPSQSTLFVLETHKVHLKQYHIFEYGVVV